MVLLRYTAGRHQSGQIIKVTAGAVEEGETLSCAHCQFTWVVRPGSGLKRGWCFLENKPVCGKKQCLESCNPWEKQMELMEAKARFSRQLERLR